MIRRTLLAACFVATCCSVYSHASRLQADDTWQAGAAATVITPPNLMWMAGYGGRDHIAEGKLTDLWAKALVLRDARGRQGVVITLDLVGIDRRLSQRICESLNRRYKLQRDQIAICTSHTHSGPVVGRNLASLHYLLLDERQQSLVDAYAETLHDKVVAVVGEALARLEPSTLAWGSGTATFAVNRRNNPAAEVPKLRAEGKLAGPQDHDVPVLAVRNAEGQLTAVLFGYACHCTVLGIYEWSGDYAGFAQMELEERHPESVALFWAGCGADQNPLPRREVALAKEYGRRLADAVDKVLNADLPAVEPELDTQYQEIPLPLGTLPSRQQVLDDAKSSNKYTAARARLLLSQLDRDGELASTYPYPVSVWRLGEVQFVHLGGEVVVDYALRLKKELAGKRTWVAGYANDVMAYIPSRRVLSEGGYEGGGAMVYYGLPTVWAPECEDRIVEAVHAMAKRPGQ
ncbi:MAG: neutral/alkaline non-lysosomal ceramidase N-terminal domain-containing protein [Pirellulaceae bacterium]